MHTIRQVAEALERIISTDHLSPEEREEVERKQAQYVEGLDKSLRNLSQRVYLPLAKIEGRIGIYDRPTIAAFAIIIHLTDFGLPRPTVEAFARWAQNSGGLLFEKRGNRFATPAEEAVSRLDRGENFEFEIIGLPFGAKAFRASWTRDPEMEAIMAEARPGSLRTRLVIPASHLIRELFQSLEGAD